MAFSKNIKNFIVSFSKNRSGEKAAEYLSKLGTDSSGYDAIKKEADLLSTQFTPADWEELKEIKPNPKTIRRWVSEANAKEITKQNDELSVLATNRDKGERRIPDNQLNDHWVRLGIIAEKLRIGLEFPNYGEGNIIESRFGGTVWGGWFYDAQHDWKTGQDNPIVLFSAEKEALWSYLLRHMDNEFKSFSVDLNNIKKNAADYVSKNLKAIHSDQIALRNDVTIKGLREKLFIVIERGNFQGICSICESKQ